jgi:MFS family permease
MVKDVYPDEKYVQAQGLSTSMFPVGSVIGLVLGVVVLQFLGWQGLSYTTIHISVIVTILSLKFIPSIKPQIVAAKASKKEAFDKDDAKNAMQSASSFGTGLRQGITLSVGLVSLLLCTIHRIIISRFCYISNSGIWFSWFVCENSETY